MKDKSTPCITTLHDLLVFDTCKFTNAEIQLKNSLPGWIGMSTSVKLKEVLLKYHDLIIQHIDKMDVFFETEEISSLSNTNRLMCAFIEDINDKLNHCTDNDVKDACLLEGIQGINHFKIWAYGTAAAFAKTMGMEKAAATFHEAEINEKQIDDRLSQLAAFEVNKRARAPILAEG